MLLTVDLPNDLATRLKPFANQLPEVLEMGLREFNASKKMGYKSLTEILEFLATLPNPKQIIALKPAPSLQLQLNELLEKNRTTGLTADEEQQWQHYEYLEHLVRIAKANALLKLKQSNEQ